MTEPRTRLRMRVLAGLVVFMFAALTTRLWFLQVLASPQFAELANQNQVRLVPLPPVRGEILDRKGHVLVGNVATTAIVVDRQEMTGREDEVLFRLSNLLKIPVKDLVERVESVRFGPYQPVPVAFEVPKQKVFYIREHPELFPGVDYEVLPVRDYPFGSLAAHILGYIGEISPDQLKQPAFASDHPGDIVGKAGVEATYESYLHGSNGTRVLQVNAQGKVLNDDFGSVAPTPGDNLVLSIDYRVQSLVEDSLLQGIAVARHTYDGHSGTFLHAPAGAVVVMDPKTGQVLAMASFPTYDPSIFVGGLSTRAYRKLSKPEAHNPFLDRAIQGLYPAGSTFKPFVAAAALKDGFATEKGRYTCPSGFTVPGDVSGLVFHNWTDRSLGAMSLTTALVISCDTVFYQFGYQYWLKYKRSGYRNTLMQQDLAQMGFGHRTGVDLPAEAAGVLPDAAYKRALYRSNPAVYGKYLGWFPGDYINLSIGQGFLQITPLQLAVAYSAIANGGTVWQPHVALKVQAPGGAVVRTIDPVSMGKIPLRAKQLRYLRDALSGVTRVGTAATAFAGFPLSRIPVAGKTGTADVIPLQPFSWFAAMAPAPNPKYVVVAMVEQGGHGSTTAAPIVRRVLEGLFGLRPLPVRRGNVVD